MDKSLKVTFILIPSLLAIIIGFNNCARFGEEAPADTLGMTDSLSQGDPNPESSEKLGLPYSLLSAEQTLSSMMKVTNTTSVSSALLKEYNSRYGSLAAGNDLGMINAPLMLSSTSLAGEVCNSLLIQEKAQADTARAFFGGINFGSGVSSLTETSFKSSVRGMARSFWGRNETEEELFLLAEFRDEFISALDVTARTQGASTNNLMLALCAGMLSSMDALLY